MIGINFIGFYKKGIAIKKENRGKFTEYCGGEVTNKCIQKGKNSKDPKIRKRATFAANSRAWSKKQGGRLSKRIKYWGGGLMETNSNAESQENTSYKQTVNPEWNTDSNWKYTFLDKNRNQIDKILSKVAHKRGLLNVLLNEGYVTNMLNSKLTVNPDSAVIARNPEKNPGRTQYRKVGNFGLDNLEDVNKRLNIAKKDMTYEQPFDNFMKVWGVNKMPLKTAAKAIDLKLNDGKKHLIKKFGNKVHTFFRENPQAEDRMLYSYYKMPAKFLNRLKQSNDIESMYDIYIKGGLNKAFKQVDNYKNIIDQYMKK